MKKVILISISILSLTAQAKIGMVKSVVHDHIPEGWNVSISNRLKYRVIKSLDDLVGDEYWNDLSSRNKLDIEINTKKKKIEINPYLIRKMAETQGMTSMPTKDQVSPTPKKIEPIIIPKESFPTPKKIEPIIIPKESLPTPKKIEPIIIPKESLPTPKNIVTIEKKAKKVTNPKPRTDDTKDPINGNLINLAYQMGVKNATDNKRLVEGVIQIANKGLKDISNDISRIIDIDIDTRDGFLDIKEQISNLTESNDNAVDIYKSSTTELKRSLEKVVDTIAINNDGAGRLYDDLTEMIRKVEVILKELGTISSINNHVIKNAISEELKITEKKMDVVSDDINGIKLRAYDDSKISMETATEIKDIVVDTSREILKVQDTTKKVEVILKDIQDKFSATGGVKYSSNMSLDQDVLGEINAVGFLLLKIRKILLEDSTDSKERSAQNKYISNEIMSLLGHIKSSIASNKDLLARLYDGVDHEFDGLREIRSKIDKISENQKYLLDMGNSNKSLVRVINKIIILNNAMTESMISNLDKNNAQQKLGVADIQLRLVALKKEIIKRIKFTTNKIFESLEQLSEDHKLLAEKVDTVSEDVMSAKELLVEDHYLINERLIESESKTKEILVSLSDEINENLALTNENVMKVKMGSDINKDQIIETISDLQDGEDEKYLGLEERIEDLTYVIERQSKDILKIEKETKIIMDSEGKTDTAIKKLIESLFDVYSANKVHIIDEFRADTGIRKISIHIGEMKLKYSTIAGNGYIKNRDIIFIFNESGLLKPIGIVDTAEVRFVLNKWYHTIYKKLSIKPEDGSIIKEKKTDLTYDIVPKTYVKEVNLATDSIRQYDDRCAKCHESGFLGAESRFNKDYWSIYNVMIKKVNTIADIQSNHYGSCNDCSNDTVMKILNLLE